MKRSTSKASAMPTTEAAWKRYVVDGYVDTVTGILETGRRLLALKGWCTKKRGGSTFNKLVREWLEMSGPTASQYCTIGKNFDKLFRHAKKLPACVTTLYEIAAADLPDEVIELEITPETTRAEAQIVKEWHRCETQQMPVRVKLMFKKAWTDEFFRKQQVAGAIELGLDPANYPTLRLLLDANIEASAARYAQPDPDGVSFEEPPDGSEVATVAELTALNAHLRMPFMKRLRWVEQHGFNACVVLGVPFGLNSGTYAALCSWLLAQLDREDRKSCLRIPFGDYLKAKEVLERATRELIAGLPDEPNWAQLPCADGRDYAPPTDSETAHVSSAGGFETSAELSEKEQQEELPMTNEAALPPLTPSRRDHGEAMERPA